MDEADVVSGRPAADATGCEANAFCFQPSDGGGQIVDPQADVVERGLMDLRALLGVDRLHQVDLDRVWAGSELEDVLVDVLFLASEVALASQAQEALPERAQGGLLEPADRDLL